MRRGSGGVAGWLLGVLCLSAAPLTAQSSEWEVFEDWNAPARGPWWRPGSLHHDVQGYAEFLQWDEIEFEFDTALGSGDVDVDDVERSRVGLRYAVGPEEAQFVLGLFGERLDDAFDDEVDMLGFEVGARGLAPLHSPGEVTVVADYGLLLSFRGGEGDDFFDDVFYSELASHFGLGIEVEGVHATAGFAASLVAGVFDTQSEIEMLGIEGDDIEGANGAAYLRVGYRDPGFPLLISVQGMLGDIEGAVASIGVRF